MADSAPKANNGLTGDPHPSTKELGKIFHDFGVKETVEQIKRIQAGKES